MMRYSNALSVLVRVLSLVSFAFLISCGDSEKDEESSVTTATYDSLWTNLFDGRCGTCHGASYPGTENGPDMRTKDGFYSSMFNIKGSAYPNWVTLTASRARCLDKAFIAPSSAAGSMLAGIFDAANSPCVVKAHDEAPQNVSVSADTLSALKTWINNGATK